MNGKNSLESPVGRFRVAKLPLGRCRELARFVDAEFDDVPGVSGEFPLLMGEENAGHQVVLLDESDRIVSHAAWRAVELVSREERIPSAGIGLVTTARGFRGHGFAARVVRACIEEARREGVVAVWLFGTPSRLYERLGFALAGRENVMRIAPSGFNHARDANQQRERVNANVRTGTSADASAILALFERHPVRAVRNVPDLERLLAVPDTRLYIHERERIATAYCIEGKGRDLQGVIHEWAGDPLDVERIIHAIATERGGGVAILAPDCLPPPIDPSQCESVELGSFAMFRILNGRRLGGESPRTVFGDPDYPSRIPIYVWGLDSV